MGKFELIEISNIEIIENKNGTMVYDLTVDENHSYTANEYIVHNCITSSNTSVHYPMASLIEGTAQVKNNLLTASMFTKEQLPKIIADGGVRNYSDVIKALALGADYVMIGGIFSKMLESAADTYTCDENGKIDFNERLDQYDSNNYKILTDKNDNYLNLSDLKKVFFGMSTKTAQKLCGKTELRTSEGIEKIIDVEYTMSGWIENFTDYLKSAMSYTNSLTLDDLEKSEIIVVSNNTFNSVNK